MSDTVTLAPPSAAKPRNVKQQAARLQAAFIHALTEADVEAIARKMIEQARDGDNTSARLVLKYGFGQLLSHMETDWYLKAEAADERKAPAAPTAEQVMAAIHDKMKEQEALEAEILGLDRAGLKPGSPHARAEGGAGRGNPPAARAR